MSNAFIFYLVLFSALSAKAFVLLEQRADQPIHSLAQPDAYDEQFDAYARDLVDPKEARYQVNQESREYAIVERTSAWMRALRYPFRMAKTVLPQKKQKPPGKLILVRCGESTWKADRRFTGWADPDLTENGLQECEHAARWVDNGECRPRARVCVCNSLSHTIFVVVIVFVDCCCRKDTNQISYTRPVSRERCDPLGTYCKNSTPSIYPSTSRGVSTSVRTEPSLDCPRRKRPRNLDPMWYKRGAIR